jgi:hypothetical protein
VLRVEPSLVVEIEAGNAYAHQRWRHIVRLLRTRADLSPGEIDLA